MDVADNSNDTDDEERYIETCGHQELYKNFYGQSKVIGTLWAVFQTEMLIYRCINEGDSWISDKFSMISLLDGIPHGVLSMPLIDEYMMNQFCRCGRFINVSHEACVCVEEACAHYFSNLEDWDRSTYIDLPQNAGLF